MAFRDVAAFLDRHAKERMALIVHQRPDGDALGSALGLAEAISGRGGEARAVNPFPLPDNLGFLAQSPHIARHDDPDWWRSYDCVGVLDCGEEGRVDEINRPALQHLPVFNIDHHASTGAGLGEAAWVEPKASSTGEMVVTLCRELGWTVTPAGAQALWTAIVTDTGRFSQENTTPDALRTARECLIAGADPVAAATELYQSVTWPERLLQRVVLQRMEVLEGGRMATSWLTGEDFFEAGCGVEGAQNMINLLRDTAGVEVAIFFYEPPADGGKKTVKASFRTRKPHNALDIVCRFGGGGHERAAGCSLPGPVEEVMETVVAASRNAFFRDTL